MSGLPKFVAFDRSLPAMNGKTATKINIGLFPFIRHSPKWDNSQFLKFNLLPCRIYSNVFSHLIYYFHYYLSIIFRNISIGSFLIKMTVKGKQIFSILCYVQSNHLRHWAIRNTPEQLIDVSLYQYYFTCRAEHRWNNGHRSIRLDYRNSVSLIFQIYAKVEWSYRIIFFKRLTSLLCDYNSIFNYTHILQMHI